MNLHDETDCLPRTRPPAAFPHPEPRNPQISITAPGLTKREYAAIHIAAAIAGRKVVFTELEAEFAKTAVALADAVLREAGE